MEGDARYMEGDAWYMKDYTWHAKIDARYMNGYARYMNGYAINMKGYARYANGYARHMQTEENKHTTCVFSTVLPLGICENQFFFRANVPNVMSYDKNRSEDRFR